MIDNEIQIVIDSIGTEKMKKGRLLNNLESWEKISTSFLVNDKLDELLWLMCVHYEIKPTVLEQQLHSC